MPSVPRRRAGRSASQREQRLHFARTVQAGQRHAALAKWRGEFLTAAVEDDEAEHPGLRERMVARRMFEQAVVLLIATKCMGQLVIT